MTSICLEEEVVAILGNTRAYSLFILGCKETSWLFEDVHSLLLLSLFFVQFATNVLLERSLQRLRRLTIRAYLLVPKVESYEHSSMIHHMSRPDMQVNQEASSSRRTAVEGLPLDPDEYERYGRQMIMPDFGLPGKRVKLDQRSIS